MLPFWLKTYPYWLAVGLIALVVGVPFLHKSLQLKHRRNIRTVDDGLLFRSGQLSPSGFERFCRERGIRTVLKLRDASDKEKDQATDASEEAYCREHGIRFVRREPKDWEADAVGRVPAEENLRWFEDFIDDPKQSPRPVLIHCFAGIHRTGSMVAVYRMKYDGWSNAEAVDELRECGYSTSTFTGNMLPFLLSYQPTRLHLRPSAVGKPAAAH